MRRTIPLILAPLLLANAQADEAPPEMPDTVKAMLDAAMKAGDEAAVNAIVKYAKAADKASVEVAEKAAGSWKRERREAAERRVREARFLDLVKGRAELGGYVTTGNSETVGLTGVLDVKREGLQWRHKWRAQADYQESLNVVVRERYLASYEPNYKVNDRLYAYGAALFESDRFLGFNERYSISAGAGYTAINDGKLRIDVELGPAYRHTAFTDNTIESQIAARGKLDIDWKLSPGITFSQDASAYFQQANSTVTTKTALRVRLFGPLSTQMSYAVNYESTPPIGRKTMDTTSRASLLVDF
jgi:putative salt-induced outer membrane protein